MGRVSILIRGHITPLITTHEPPSMEVLAQEKKEAAKTGLLHLGLIRA